MRTVNIGILAHVDAGKTSLTERILYDTGVIDRLGRVDRGDTQTDTDQIERRRGITIRSAVASFTVGSLRVNLIDTPGHSDFVAEVDRAPRVLDGAVLLVSAVAGVQPRTRVLMRALLAERLPALLFVNKIDSAGARDPGDLLTDVNRALTPYAVPLASVSRGTGNARTDPYDLSDPDRRAEVAERLADHDDSLLAELVAGSVPEETNLRRRLAARTAEGTAHPVFFGSALTGQGVAELLDGIDWLLPPAGGDPTGPARGTVFAIDRGPGGDKIAYLRLRSGELRERQRITVQRTGSGGGQYTGQITGLTVLGAAVGTRLVAGGIGAIRGLAQARVGDHIGPPGPDDDVRFAPPTLRTVVRPVDPGRAGDLYTALAALAERDPLISATVTESGEISVLLYGEVQKEVIAATLLEEYGVASVFSPSRPVYLERPVGIGAAREAMTRFLPATVGLRVEPGRPGSGVGVEREIRYGDLPRAFHRAIEESTHHTLEQGPHGWPVTDCVVTLTDSGFAPMTGAGDFRVVTPMVLMRALAAAGTRVYEPCHAFELEVPEDALGVVTANLAGQEVRFGESSRVGDRWLVTGEIPARRVQGFCYRLPGLSGGEGVWTSRPAGDRPVVGRPPERARTDGNPLNREEYLRHLAQR